MLSACSSVAPTHAPLRAAMCIYTPDFPRRGEFSQELVIFPCRSNFVKLMTETANMIAGNSPCLKDDTSKRLSHTRPVRRVHVRVEFHSMYPGITDGSRNEQSLLAVNVRRTKKNCQCNLFLAFCSSRWKEALGKSVWTIVVVGILLRLSKEIRQDTTTGIVRRLVHRRWWWIRLLLRLSKEIR